MTYNNLPMAQIISEYQSGMTMKELVEKYGVGVTRDTIWYRLKKAEIKKTERRGRKKMNLPVAQIISEYQSGISPKELGEKYGVSLYCIYEKLKDAGVQKITAKERNMMGFPMEQVISEYQSGMSMKELGEKYGVSYSTLKTRLKKAGVKKITAFERNMMSLPTKQIISEYQSGISPKDLSKKYNLSITRIRSLLKYEGVKKITARERNTMRLPMAQIISEYQSGMTMKELGEKYGVGAMIIWYRLKEAGVKTRGRVDHLPTAKFRWISY